MKSSAAVKVQDIVVKAGHVSLPGFLAVPPDADKLVVFAHGSGSSRHSPRNRYVADVLNASGIATLLTDLLTPQEEGIDNLTGELRFDIPFLAERLTGAVDWVASQKRTGSMCVGLFGASTGAAAALITAAERPDRIAAVVSRGGRPDLARDALPRVVAPTLLIVGQFDPVVIDLNRQAASMMKVQHEIRIVPGATHLFEEPGTLEQAARHAEQWFSQWLRPRDVPA